MVSKLVWCLWSCGRLLASQPKGPEFDSQLWGLILGLILGLCGFQEAESGDFRVNCKYLCLD